jgi:2-polyprenyl-3-methyl-5-hydroxy-6-metoxy-1,4-benzoquinol methylase
MTEIFYRKTQNNYFDNLVVDVKKIYSKYPINKKFSPKINHVNYINRIFYKIYRSSLFPLKARVLFWKFLRQTNIDLTWFNEFEKYWTDIIGGRPLWNLQDLFFLKNLYRIKFQESQIPDTEDSKIHLEAWQRPELIYQLLHLVCKESSLINYKLLKLLRKYKKKFNSFLEFGCGTAPITTSLFELFHLSKKLKIIISDIQTLAFNYAAYKFRNCSNVKPVLLVSEKDFLININEKVDIITCISVFEHLNKPLETIKIFHKTLNPKGLLFFDYIKSSGGGLDTIQAKNERENVLDYMKENFKIIYGSITKDKHIGLTILKKS